MPRVAIVAVAVLGALLLGFATLWDGPTPDAAIDPARAKADAVDQASDPERPRHDTEERVVDSGLVDPAVADIDQDLRLAAESKAENVNLKSATFKIATFNVLASQHTEPGGQRAGWPGAGYRSAETVGFIKRHGVEVAGLQEVKSGQLAAITGGTGFKAWPGGGDPDNSVIWDPKKFDLVSTDQFSVYFMSRNRPQTVVRLRHKESRREFYLINMHPSAGHGGKYASSRNAAFGTLVSYVNNLKSERVPIFVTGDMNDRGNFYCRVIPPTGLVAAQGGGGTCGSAPRMRPVDWITGYGNVSFTNYVDDFSSESKRVSDHPFVSATATMRGAKG